MKFSRVDFELMLSDFVVIGVNWFDISYCLMLFRLWFFCSFGR